MESNNRLLTSEIWRNAVVVFANYSQFTRGQIAEFPSVSSRMLAYCKDGYGSITVNGERKELSPSTFLFTPWRHQIKYEASDRDPFLLACCHIIPDHDPDVHVRYAVSHEPDDEMADYVWRRDVQDPLLDGVVEGSRTVCPALESLMDYVIMTSTCQSPPPLLARQFAQLILWELTHAPEPARCTALSVPTPLSQIMLYLQARVHNPLRTEEIRQEALSRQFGISSATIRRLFMKHLGVSPTEWIVDQRIACAKAILRESAEPIVVVAALSGFTDTSYFSKVFHKRTGLSPSEWRTQARWPSRGPKVTDPLGAQSRDPLPHAARKKTDGAS